MSQIDAIHDAEAWLAAFPVTSRAMNPEDQKVFADIVNNLDHEIKEAQRLGMFVAPEVFNLQRRLSVWLKLHDERWAPPEELATARELETVEAQNANALMALMRDFSLTLRAQDAILWRPTKRHEGEIAGLGAVTILATDGNLAFFCRLDGRTLMGHIRHFDGKVEPLFSTRAEKEATVAKKEPKKRKTQLDRALELLEQLAKG